MSLIEIAIMPLIFDQPEIMVGGMIH